MKNKPDFYRYILAYDDGWAPCPYGGLVTLATCKPRIRKTAEVGDWVAGFLPGSQHRGLVAWVGRVGSKIGVGDYEKTYRGRRDAVYRQKLDGTFERLKPDYHSGTDEIRKDLWAPVLVFDKTATWYFGDAPYELPIDLMPLAGQGQGHRVRLRLPNDLDQLQQWLGGIGPAGIYGEPRMQAKLDGCGGCAPEGARRVASPSRGCS